MALIPGICTQCGATLTADDTKDCMICPYCNTPFIVEKAINNFHNTYNISNSTVNIYSKENDDFVIRAGVLEKYNGSETKVTIPTTVSFIGHHSFKDCYGLTEVIVPEGVTAINNGAFYNCKSLEKISLPDTLTTIEGYAFEDCKNLREVSLPDTLTTIGDSAFRGCENLREVSLPDSLQKLGTYAFSDCSNLEKVRMPNNECICHNSSTPNNNFFHCDKLYDVILPNASWEKMLFGSAWLGQRGRRRLQNLCPYCGGTFKGVFTKICSKCGKPKDY